MVDRKMLLGAVAVLTFVTVLTSCTGCGGRASSFISRSTYGVEAPSKDAVILKVEGEVDAKWVLDLDKVAADENTKLIILWIESPGGYVSESKLLAHGIEVVRTKYNKPIWVYSEYVLASGAYWVAMECDSIFVSPVALVGSIGVYSMRVDATAQDSLMGLKYFFFQSSPEKTSGNPHTPVTPEELSAREAGIRPIYIAFLTQVATHRFSQLQWASWVSGNGSDTGSVCRYLVKIANGNVYGGEISVELGLSDGVYYFDQFADYLRKLGYTVKNQWGRTIKTFYD